MVTKSVKLRWVMWFFFSPSDKAFIFTVTLSWRRERQRERASEDQLSEEIALHSPSSLQVCFPLLLSWMSAIRHAQLDSCQMCGLALGLLPTGDWACCRCVYESVCLCVCVCVHVQEGKKKLSSFPYQKLPTRNDVRTQTNMHAHTLSHTLRDQRRHSSRLRLLQAAAWRRPCTH